MSEASRDKTTGWQPIETAPPQKILLLFCVTDERDGEIKNWKMATGCKDHLGEWVWDGRRLKVYDHQPSHWMRLPSPPVGLEGTWRSEDD